jgi:two-component system, NarL family, response regulator DegU
MHRQKQIFFAALEAGVSGYVLKDDAVANIVKAVHKVAAGDTFISSDLTAFLLEKARIHVVDDPADQRIRSLTDAEKKTLRLIAQLKTNSEIAEALHVTRRTIENYKSILVDKLDLPGAKHLLPFAFEHKDKLQ